MKKNNEGGSVILLGFFTVLFAVITIFIFASSAGYLFGSAKDLKSMLNKDGEPVKDEFVSLDVDLVFDWYAETEYKINGFIPAGTEKHCLVYMDDIGEQGAFISLTVKGKDDFKAIDKLISESEDYMNYLSDSKPDAVTFEGKISTIDPEVSQYYTEFRTLFTSYYSSYGWFPEFYQVTIDSTENKGAIWLRFGICLAITIFFAVAMVAAIKKKKEDKLQAAATANAMVGEGNDLVFGNLNSSEDNSNDTEV